jgi:hypothetical protein
MREAMWKAVREATRQESTGTSPLSGPTRRGYASVLVFLVIAVVGGVLLYQPDKPAPLSDDAVMGVAVSVTYFAQCVPSNPLIDDKVNSYISTLSDADEKIGLPLD